jgi:hypothetical protein
MESSVVCPAMAHHIPVPRWHKLIRSGSLRLAAIRCDPLRVATTRELFAQLAFPADKTCTGRELRLSREKVTISDPQRIAADRNQQRRKGYQGKSCLTTTPQRHYNDSGKSDRKVAPQCTQATPSGRTPNSPIRITLFCTVTPNITPLPRPRSERYHGVNPARIRGKHTETGNHV